MVTTMKRQKSKNISAYPIPTICAYCCAKVIFTSNAAIYGKEYGNGRCYKCTRCNAYVGVHTGTKTPLGRLANEELRSLKMNCHNLFDRAWKGPSKRIERGDAYKFLAALLNIPAPECHFGWFDKPMLLKCLEILENPRWYTIAKGEVRYARR